VKGWRRLIGVVIGVVSVIYVIFGLVLLSTANAGGVSLGLLFLGGAAALAVTVSLLAQLERIYDLVWILVQQGVGHADDPQHTSDGRHADSSR
jgi:hypothetical protein